VESEGKRSSKLVKLVKTVVRSNKIIYLEDGSRWLLVASGELRSNVKLLVRIAAVLCGVLLMALSARTSIVTPFTEVPFTFQTLVLTMIILLLGKDAWKTVSTYLILGFAGLPMFAYGGGLQYVASPTTGYLMGFLVASLLGRLVGKGKNLFKWMLISITAMAVVYIFGWLWLSIYYAVITGFNNVFNSMYVAFLRGVIPFVVWDLMKALIASLLSYELYGFRGKLKALKSLLSSFSR